MDSLSAYFSELAYASYWALGCSLAQGMVLYIGLSLCLKMFPKLASRHRYLVAYGTFVLLFLWFGQTLYSQLLTQEAHKAAHSYTSMHAATAPPQPSLPATDNFPAITSGTNMPAWQSAMYVTEPFLLSAYFAGLALMIVRFLMGMSRIKRLRNLGTTELPDEWRGVADACAAKMGLTRPVWIRLSQTVRTPLVIGSLRPLILLPVALFTQLSVAQVEAILLHELAHIRRHDYFFNLLQVVAETILFFNPFIWLLSRRIRNLREEGCDEAVLAITQQPIPYAYALVRLEDYRSAPKLALAARGPSTQLFNRIKKITTMNNTRYATNPWHVTAVMLLLVSGIAFLAPINNLMAQKTKLSRKTQKMDTTEITEVTLSTTLGNQLFIKYNVPYYKTTKRKDDKDTAFLAQLKKTDTSKASFVLSSGEKYELNLFDDPLRLHRIIKGQHVVGGHNELNYDELRAKYHEAFSSAYQKIMNPELAKFIEDELNYEIGETKDRKAFSRQMQIAGAEREQKIKKGIDELVREGLLDTMHSFHFSCQKSDGLIINGKTQPASAYQKYRAYFPELLSCSRSYE